MSKIERLSFCFCFRTCAHFPVASNSRASVRSPAEASASTALALEGGGLCWGGIVETSRRERSIESEEHEPLEPLFDKKKRRGEWGSLSLSLGSAFLFGCVR